MTILQLTYFLTLADNLHYTKTAEELHISQPSLSYAISELEKDLGTALFVRDKQSISLSPAGKLFYPYAKKSIEALNSSCLAVSRTKNADKSVVRMGYFHSISTTLIPNLINCIRQNNGQNIQFELVEDSVANLISLLKRSELDFCFSCHREAWAESVAIAQQPLYLAVSKSHRLASKKVVTFEDFSSEQQVMLTPGSDLRAQMDQLFDDNDCIPRVAIETRECNAALQYVALNFGVSVLPQVPVMDSDSLMILPILKDNEHELSRTIYLTYRKSRHMSDAAFLAKEYILDNLTM